ncbi:MAG: AI-2E family transporter [Paenibacillaceae bacterium]
MARKSFLYKSACVISVLIIIYMIHKINFLFIPLITIFNMLLVPVVIAGFFYYLLRPVVYLLDKWKVNRTVSVILIYVCIVVLFTILIYAVLPTLQKQITDFVKNVPNLIQSLGKQIRILQENSYFSAISIDYGLSAKLSEYANQGFSLVMNYTNRIFGFISDFIVVIGTFPIILFFLLRESEKAPRIILHIIPKSYRSDAKEAIDEIDSALSGYISGRMISTLLLGVMTYIAFIIIGVPYAFLLSIVLAIISFIPLIGSFLGAIPPLIVAFTQSPGMAVWVIVGVFICQQIQDNVLSPFIFGKKLDIHPFTTIIILLIAGSLAGIMGMLLALPVYMIVKIITVHIYQLFYAEKVHEMTEQ